MKNRFVIMALALGLVVGLSSITTAQPTRHVNCSVPGPGTGTSGDPFNTIQLGLNGCDPGDKVEVADGTCTEEIVWPDINSIRLYSASGNPSACIINGMGISNVISVAPPEGGDTLSLTIDGLTIQNGGKAGIRITPNVEINATIDNVEIKYNGFCGIRSCKNCYFLGENAGEKVDLRVTGSTISDNRSPEIGQPYYSAGIYCRGPGSLTVTGCTISRNNCGGIGHYNDLWESEPPNPPPFPPAHLPAVDALVVIHDNEVFGNSGTPFFEGDEEGFGINIFNVKEVYISSNRVHHNYENESFGISNGGICVVADKGSIVGNEVHDHISTSDRSDGGYVAGISVAAPGQFLVDKNLIYNNQGLRASEWYAPLHSAGLVLLTTNDSSEDNDHIIRVTNNIIRDNGTHGIFALTGFIEGTRKIYLTNNTVADNGAVGIEEDTGIPEDPIHPWDPNAHELYELEITNCIVGNWDSDPSALDLAPTVDSEFNVSYSDVQDDLPAGTDGGNNISANPNFMNYHIDTNSPCKDTGSPSAPGLPSHDVDWDYRDAIPDMGADEYVKNQLFGCWEAKASWKIYDCNDPTQDVEGICGENMPEETCTYFFYVYVNAFGQFTGTITSEFDPSPEGYDLAETTYFGQELTEGLYAATFTQHMEGWQYLNPDEQNDVVLHRRASAISTNLEHTGETASGEDLFEFEGSIASNFEEPVNTCCRSFLGCTQEAWGEIKVYHTVPNPCTAMGLRSTKISSAAMEDTDGDGIPDAEEDLDLDSIVDPGETDYNNVDTDGDGIWDSVERGYQVGNPGDLTYDMDQTTLTDPLSADSDGDNGWNGHLGLDGQEDANFNGRVDTGETDPLFSSVDRDSDGFTVSEDCKDNPIDDLPECASNPELPGCAKNINPDASEECNNGIDDDCDGRIDSADIADCGYSAVANAEASVYGRRSLVGSGIFNAVVLLVIPVGAVVMIRVLRRKK